MEHYLDNAATTKVCPEAAEAAMRAMTHDYGNPSSTHTKGREADKLLSFSRAQVAKALGCEPKELVFTSCGSESNNWALSAGADCMKRKGRHIISSELEHESVRRELDRLESLGYEITKLRGDKTGAVSPAAVGEALREDTILVSLMAVNNDRVTCLRSCHSPGMNFSLRYRRSADAVAEGLVSDGRKPVT